MKPLALAALSLVLLAGSASASTTVPRVDAIADPVATDRLSVACNNPTFSDADVTTVLGSTNHYQTGYLRTDLRQAVSEACGQNVASIVVRRRGVHVDWSPNRGESDAVAIALR